MSTDTEVALFIGGPADGQRRKVYRGQPTCEVVIMPRVPYSRHLSAEALTPFTTTHYERHTVSSPNGPQYVFAPAGTDVLSQLITGYRQPGR